MVRQWNGVDLKGKSMDDYIEQRDDISSLGKPSAGKCYYQCSLKKRYNCNFLLRAFKCPLDDFDCVERSGEHTHDNENFSSGFPHEVKQEIRNVICTTPAAKPQQIRFLLRRKYTNADIGLKKVQGFVKRIRSESKDIFMDNTIGGLTSFAMEYKLKSNQLPTGLFVLANEISEERQMLVISSISLLQLLERSFKLYSTLTISLDGTYKLLWNGFPFLVLGLNDILHQFHPVAFLFTSKEDEISYDFLIQAVKQQVNYLFRFSFSCNFAVSDNSNEIFNSVLKNFPDCTVVNCYAHMCRNVSKKYKKYLIRKNKMDEIIKDLKEIQTLSCVDDINIAIKLWEEKYSNESAFLAQFKESYLTGHKKNWLRGFLVPGIPCSNNGHERFNLTIKNTLSFQQRMSARNFLNGMVEWIRQLSDDHSNSLPENLCGSNAYHKDRIRDVLRKSQLMVREKLFTFEKVTETEYFVISSDIRSQYENWQQILTYYSLPETDDLETFLGSKKLLYLISPSDGYFGNDCSCPHYSEYGQCKHIVAFSILQGTYKVPDMYSISSIGKKKKTGRPKKLPSALLRD